MTATVSTLTLYPVKSLQGMPVREAYVEPRGFRGDRRFMVTTPDGEFLTQRECRSMARVGARLSNDVLTLSAPSQDPLDLPVADDDREPTRVTVWQSTVGALRVGAGAEEWLTEALGRPARLVQMPDSTQRAVDPEYNRGKDTVSFADGYPYLVVGDSSLDDLNQRLGDQPVSMVRFRPNITVAGTDAYAEDGWKGFRIAQVAFEGVKLCGRCVIPTIDVETAQASREPLATLARYRTQNGLVMFGLNVVPDGSGVVRVGDPVFVDAAGHGGGAA